MANKIISTVDSAVTAAGTSLTHFGCPIEVESGYILQFVCPTSSTFGTIDYTVDVATGAIGAETATAIATITPENSGKICTKSVMFDATHMLTVFQDNTSGNVSTCMSEWNAGTHTLTSNTITDLGITGNGFHVNLEQIDSTHYLISYDTGTDLVAQVIEVNAGTYVVTTVGTPLTTGTTYAVPHSHVVQIDATHYAVSFTKKSAGKSGFFMIVEVNAGTWAVTTATAVTDLGSTIASNVYITSRFIESATWIFKLTATKVAVFYTTGVAANQPTVYKIIDINTGTWVITVGAEIEMTGWTTYQYYSAYLTQPDLAVAEAYFSTIMLQWSTFGFVKLGFDVAQNQVTCISNTHNYWMRSNYESKYSTPGQVTELTGGNVLVNCFQSETSNHQIYSFSNDDPINLSPSAGITSKYQGTRTRFGDVVALDSTHFVVLGMVYQYPFMTYEVSAAGQIELLDYSFSTGYYESVTGLKLDSTHLLLSGDQNDFRVAEVDGSGVGSWSAAQTTLAGGNDAHNGVKMYIAGEDASYWYVIVNRFYSSYNTAVSVVSVDKATYVVAQVGSDLVGGGTQYGYDMTPIEGYTDKWLTVYNATTWKARVVGVDGSFEPVFEGVAFDSGAAGRYQNVQSVDATHFITTYSDASSHGWAETLAVNVGTWAVSIASAAAYEFETGNVGYYKSRLAKVDSEHAVMYWGYDIPASQDYEQYICYGVLGVLKMDSGTFNITISEKVKMVSSDGSYSAVGLLDSDTVITSSQVHASGSNNLVWNIGLWDAVVAGATQVAITGAGADFVAGSSTTLEVEVQDGAGVVDAADNTTQITFTPASQGQITGTVTGVNISGTGAVGNPRVVEVTAGVAKVTEERYVTQRDS